VPGYVGQWVNYVNSELNTPDPWKALPGYANIADLRIAPDVANTQFAFAETQQVAKALEDIRRLLLHRVRGSTEQMSLVNEQIDSLVESSKKMGRKDWFNITIGNLITLAIAIALPQDVTKQMFQILKDALGGVVHFLPPILAAGHQLLG